jgi:transcriptional regulator GlxA family with amidase domain
LLSASRDADTRGAQQASICTGAFVLAKAGLLDGRTVTTHWRYANELSAAHPQVRVRPEVLFLFVEDGPVVTSAGLAAGIDLCLHLIRSDHGRADRARALLETTHLPLALIAHRCGIGTVDSLRDHVIQKIGLTPSAYRAAFTHSREQPARHDAKALVSGQ